MNEIINNIANFTNVDFGEVRVWTDENGNSWFFGVDVCRALGYSDSRQAIRKNVDRRDVIVYEGVEYTKRECGSTRPTSPNRMRDNTRYLLINESGLYQLVCRSRKPEAAEFLRWVTDAVLPSIRKYGLYIQQDLLEDNDRLRRIIEAYKASLEAAYAELDDYQQSLAEAQAEIDELKYKADYYDDYLASEEYTMCMTQIAGLHGMSAYRLHKILHEHKVIYKCRRCWRPTIHYINSGYMKRVMYEYHDPEDGSPYFREAWEWTPAGERFIHDFLDEHGYKKQAQ